MITKCCQILQSDENVSNNVSNTYVQRSTSRRNHLKALKKLDTLETGRNNEADDTEKRFLNSSSVLYPLKVVQEIIVTESDVEKNKIL